MTDPILAIHYRLSNEPNNTAAGHWKEFTSEQAADTWLKFRSRKTPGSPKGTIIFQNKEQIETVLKYGFENQPVSLQLALKNYLRWKRT